MMTAGTEMVPAILFGEKYVRENINEFRLNNYRGEVQDAYDDVLHHPESEYREEELDCLVDLVYREGFKYAIVTLQKN